jgi:hypothetical protein
MSVLISETVSYTSRPCRSATCQLAQLPNVSFAIPALRSYQVVGAIIDTIVSATCNNQLSASLEPRVN